MHCKECEALALAIDRYIEKAENDLGRQLDKEGYVDGKATSQEIGTLEDDVANALVAETDYVVKRANAAVDLTAFADNWEAIKQSDDIGRKLLSIFKRHFKRFMPKLISEYLKQTDRSLTLRGISKRTVAWIDTWSVGLSEIMKLNSHKEIEDILKAGLQKGSSIQEFVQDILNSGIRDEYYKARRVAVTEVLTAHSVAQQEAFEQNPSVKEKLWRHTGAWKNEPRDNHVDMDNERVPVDEPFELNGINGGVFYPMYPRDVRLPPEERINCHCVEEPVVNKEILGLPLEERQRLQAEAIEQMDASWEAEVDARNRAKAGTEEAI